MLFFAQTASADYRFSAGVDSSTGDVNGELFTSNVPANSFTDNSGIAEPDGSTDNGQYDIADVGSSDTPDSSDQPDQPLIVDYSTSGETTSFATPEFTASFAPPDPVGFGLAPEPATFGIIGFMLCGVGIALRRKA